MRIAVDFDGTIVTHAFPQIGEELPHAIFWLRLWKLAGHELILWTMRCGKYLEEAIDWCDERGLRFDGHNQGIDDCSWTLSPKVYAHVYIDDAAFGCPLIRPEGQRPYVD